MRLFRWMQSVGAVAAICLGLGLIVREPLPERIDYTGELIGDRYFAPEVGALAPPFTLTTLSGETVDLLSERGRPVVLNFWATWCVPCAVEMPELQALQDAYPQLTLWAVNVGERDSQAQVWLDERDLTLTTLMDRDSAVAARYLLRGQPTSVVIAPDGTILSVIFGPTTRDQLQSILSPFL